MKSLLLFGGTGFFGRSFIRAFINGKLDNWKISELLIASRNGEDFVKRNPKYFSPKIRFFDLDISTIFEIPKCDYVMHFAGSSDKASYQNNLQTEILNIEQNMLSFVKSIEKSTSDPSYILYASSGAVYGPTDIRKFSENDTTKKIDSFTSIKRHYAKAKLVSENTFHQLAKNRHKLSIARCFSFVGPELPLNTHFAAGNLIRNILNSEALEIKADNPVIRSYLHTDDLVTWLMEIMLHGNSTCPVFNVGSDNSIEIHDLAKQLSNYFGLSTKIELYSEQNVDLYVPNIDKARSIGLQPHYTSAQAIIKAVDEIKYKLLGHGI